MKEGLEGARKHLLEADDHNAVCGTVRDGLSCHMQSCRTGGAVVVDVVDGDLCHAELVEDTLAAGGVSVAVACYSLFDIIVIDLGIEKGFDTSL